MKKKIRKQTSKKRKLNIRWSTYVLVILDFCAVIGVFTMYGPLSYVRDWYVTTAMGTGNHRYLAQIFYSNDSIKKIMANNSITDIGEDTDTTGIIIGGYQDDGNYASVYEQQILEKEFDGQEYKVIEINENRYKGFLVAIYDPSRISLAVAKGKNGQGEIATDIAAKTEAKVLINGSAFGKGTGKLIPHGTTIVNGKIVSKGRTKANAGLIGFTNDDVLVLCKDTPANLSTYNFRDAVYFGPFFIINGKPSYTSGQAGGLQPRTAIGQRKDGIVLFLVIDGRSSKNGIGANYADITKIFLRYGAVNAGNMDGGGSTSLVVDGELKNNPCGWGSCGQGYTQRYIPNAWVFK